MMNIKKLTSSFLVALVVVVMLINTALRSTGWVQC